MTGDIGMDASGISLAGVTLKTPFSRIEANISAGEGFWHWLRIRRSRQTSWPT
ncbi:MAG: hypothetical protein ACLRQT_09665 [Alistipes sp.]